MSISNASLLSGCTMAPSGGSALAFASAGIQNGINPIYATADTDLRTRRSILTSIKEPKVSSGAPNGYTQARSVAVLKAPLELENGNITINTLRIELAVDVETTTAEKTELLVLGSQILNDADFTDLFQNLNLN